MNHDEAAKLLGAYRDGELDLATCLKLEEHLAGCELCQQQLAGEEQLVEAIHTQTTRYMPSPFLKTRITAALREKRTDSERPSRWNPFAKLWAVSGTLAALMAVAVLAAVWTQREPMVAQEAVANHVRSLQVSHLIDVVSTDQHTVKPWFAGKLDFSPQVVDLGPSGYPLVGGRLDVLDHHNVAAIVYQRRKHYINLFVWPEGAGSYHGHLYDDNGYRVFGWSKSGMNYLAVSELGEKELKEFARMIQEQTVDPKTGE